MRRLSACLLAGTIALLVPMTALAANQEVAEQIAANLRQSGQLQDYKIGVKYQDGTAWLRGRVASQEQINAVLKVVFKTPGVTRVVNNMTVVSGVPTEAKPESPVAASALRQPLQQVRSLSAPERIRAALPSLRTPCSFEANTPKPTSSQAARRLDQVLTRAAKQMFRSVDTADRVPTSFTPAAAKPVTALETGNQPTPVAQQPRLAPPREMATQTNRQPVANRTAAGRAPQGVSTRPMMMRRRPVPVAVAQASPRLANQQAMPGQPVPAYVAQAAAGPQVRYDQPQLPNYAWPSYAAYPNYAACTYPKQYSPTAWPYIGPFYPYPQVPLGWRKVTLEWDDGWWMLDFKD